ncbi:MAG: bifunctional N-acetylglucosamine-1-phosphate uridyltransferase/glucosamine-1-phosphate acetyltransferase, partial [Dehalococcoidia bacterium]
IVEERDVREASTPTLSGPEGPRSSEARPEEKGAVEVNAGVYCFQAGWLWEHLRQLAPGPEGEVYLTALVALAVDSGARVEGLRCEEPWEVLGVNHRVQLAQAEAVMRQRIRERWMLEGVTIVDPASTYIDASVELGQDTVIQPNTTLAGRTRVGRGCLLGPGSIIVDSTVGDRCRVVASMLEESVLEPDVDVGPFSHLRPGAHVESGVHIGNFVEVKQSRLAQGVRVGHFSYIGDASIGARANIGAGTITCNFDGVKKHRTVVEEEAFVGCDTMLVAPVKVGARAVTGAGSVVTKDVPPDTLAVGVPATTRPRRRKKA